MQRSTLTLALVLALILGAAALWSSMHGGTAHRGADLSEPRAASRSDARAPAPVDLDSAGPGMDEGGTPRVADPADASEARAEQREAVPASTDAVLRKEVQLRVVDGVPGRPVEGASVFVRLLETRFTETEPGMPPPGPGDPDQGRADRWDGAALDALVAGRPALRTNAEGLVSVPAPLGGATVIVARHAGRWGRRVLDEQGRGEDGEPNQALDRVEELVLAPDQVLVARVVDPLGLPVSGVPVQLRYMAWNDWQAAREVLTDGELGEARFEHVQLEFDEVSDFYGSFDEASGWRLALDVAVPEPAYEKLDPADLPAEPVLFELARGGTVVVEVSDPGGARLSEGGRVALGVVAEGQTRRPSAFNRDQRHRVEVELSGERTRFDHVALGQELDVSFRRDGGNGTTHVFAAGPALAGDEVRVGVTLGADHPVLRLRLLDTAGQPLVDESVELRTKNDQIDFGTLSIVRTDTDDTGHVLLELDAGWTKGHVELARRGEEQSAVLELDREFPDGLTDLGDVVLAPTPLIVSGRAVGPAGRAIASAVVWLLEERDRNWRRLGGYDAETDAEGAFELRGGLDGERYRVRLRKDGYYGRPVEFERGTSGLVVELSRAGAIVGSVLLSEDVPADLLSVRLEPAGEEPVELSGRERQAGLEEDGSFRCGPLPAGVFDVQLILDGSQEIVHEVKGVVVVAGRDTRDPLLEVIDLRGELYAFKLTIVGFDEGHQINGTLRLGEAGAEELKSRRRFRQPEVVVIALQPAIDVDVEVRGFRTVALRGITGDARVELQRGSRVRVVLVGGGEPLSSPFGLSVGFVALDGGSQNMDWASPRFDERGEIVVRATASGLVRVMWIVERSVGGSAMATSSPAEPEQVVNLRGGSGEQRVEVRLTREEAARLRKILGDS